MAHGGSEHGHRDYQVLTNPENAMLVWVPASDGEVPLGAIQGGEQCDGERLFIGRAYYNGSMVIGKVHPGHRTLYVSFDGGEVPINDYEVLVCREVLHWVHIEAAIEEQCTRCENSNALMLFFEFNTFWNTLNFDSIDN